MKSFLNHKGIENCSCIFDTSAIHGGRTKTLSFYIFNSGFSSVPPCLRGKTKTRRPTQ